MNAIRGAVASRAVIEERQRRESSRDCSSDCCVGYSVNDCMQPLRTSAQGCFTSKPSGSTAGLQEDATVGPHCAPRRHLLSQVPARSITAHAQISSISQQWQPAVAPRQTCWGPMRTLQQLLLLVPDCYCCASHHRLCDGLKRLLGGIGLDDVRVTCKAEAPDQKGACYVKQALQNGLLWGSLSLKPHPVRPRPDTG